MLLEMRRYQTKPGERDAWVRYFDEKIAPCQIAKGMTILGAFIDEEDETGFVWLRRFENEEDRVAQYAAVYDSDEWNNDVMPGCPELSGVTVTRLVPLASSAMQ
jgi:hypothetical protein